MAQISQGGKMDAKTFVSLKDGRLVRPINNTDMVYRVVLDKGCVIAVHTIFLNSHEIQGGKWEIKDGGSFKSIKSASQVGLGSVLKKKSATEVYVVCGYSHASCIACTSTFITSPENWDLLLV